jgi:MFS family permease
MSDPEGLSGPEWRRAWRIITWAGFLGSTYYLLCVAGAPRVKYLTELEATPFDFGLISSLGAFVLAFQVVGSMLSNRVVHRKVLWVSLALVHRLLFLGVLLAPLLTDNPRLRIAWIILVLFCHDSLAQVSVPIWFSWMADLVPKESMSRHWAARQRVITMATIVVMFLIAVGFQYFETTDRVVLGFSILGCLGVIVGAMDILLFLRVPEPPHERVENVPWRQVLLQPLRDRDFRRFLVFMGYWHFTVFLAAPFFGLYVLVELDYSVFTLQLLGTAGALGVVVSSRFWGLVCDVYGFRPVLQILSVAKIFTPTAFLLAPRTPAFGIAYFAVVWFIDGIINAGLALAFQGPLLKFTPRRNRTMYIAAAYFLAIGTMASVAPAFAGYLIKSVNALDPSYGWLATVNGYHVAFAMSVVLGVAAFPLAGRIIEPTAGPLKTVISQVFSLSSLRVPKWAHKLQDGRREAVRVRAAKTLGTLRNPMAVGDLINALRDDAHAVRDAAAEALGSVGSSQAIQPLVDALFDTKSGIQSPAARALGQIGGIDSLRALLRYLQGRKPEALADTVDALARIGDDAALLPLICLFNEAEDEALRKRAAGALATLSQTDSLEEVVEMLHARRPFYQQFIK